QRRPRRSSSTPFSMRCRRMPGRTSKCRRPRSGSGARCSQPVDAMSVTQDKQKEIAFFDAHASADEYDVFTPETNARLIGAITRLLRLPPGARVAVLGCGSGVFCDLLRNAGYTSVGLDISPKLIELGRQKYPGVEFHVGDVEQLPFPAGSLDGVL